MVATETTIHVEPGSKLDTVLAESNGRPIVLVRQGVRYRVRPEAERVENEGADLWANYDPERLMEGVRRAAGSISEAEAEEMIENIYRWPEEGSRR